MTNIGKEYSSRLDEIKEKYGDFDMNTDDALGTSEVNLII